MTIDIAAPPNLIRNSFSPSDLAKVQGFDCGDAPYEREVAAWIQGPDSPEIDSAATSVNHPKRPGRVWLYRLDDGTVVGFGALGFSEWRWRGKKDPHVPVSILFGSV